MIPAAPILARLLPLGPAIPSLLGESLLGGRPVGLSQPLYPVLAVMVDLHSLLLGLLMIAGIVALAFIAYFFFELSKVLVSSRALLEKTSPDLEESIAKLPDTIDRVNQVADRADSLMDGLQTEAEGTLGRVNLILEDLSIVTSNVADTSDHVRRDAMIIKKNIANFARSHQAFGGAQSPFQAGGTMTGRMMQLAALLRFLVRINQVFAKKKKRRR